MCKGLEERDWPEHGTESWLEPKLWPVRGDRQGLIHTGPPQQVRSLGLVLRKMGSYASVFLVVVWFGLVLCWVFAVAQGCL